MSLTREKSGKINRAEGKKGLCLKLTSSRTAIDFAFRNNCTFDENEKKEIPRNNPNGLPIAHIGGDIQ
jgi:hypothetical protein